MNTDTAQILASLERQTALLQQLIALHQPKQELGFTEPPKTRYVFCNRSHKNCLWYYLNDAGDAVAIPQAALTCYLEKLEFKQVERRGKDTWKLHLHVRANSQFVLEAGADSNFAKCLLSSLAACSPEWLSRPVTIEVQAADSDEVLFCRLYANGELVFAPWDKSTDWKSVAKLAVQVVGSRNGAS